MCRTGLVFALLFTFLNRCCHFVESRKELFRFVVVKTDKDVIKPAETTNSDVPADENAVVFHHVKHNHLKKVIDHEGETSGYHKTIYFLRKNVLKIVPDMQTFKSLGFTEQDLEPITKEEFLTYHFEFALVPVAHLTNDGPDEIMRLELLRNKLLQGLQILDPVFLGDYINPAVLPFKGRYLLITGLAWGKHDNHVANEHLEFRWTNHSLASFQPSKQRKPLELRLPDDPNTNDPFYLGVNEVHVDYLQQTAIGQDPRPVLINENEAYVVYTWRFARKISMGFALIAFNKTSNMISMPLVTPNIGHEEGFSDQKNWSPFLLPDNSNDLYLIQRVNPLVVYKIRYPSPSTFRREEKTRLETVGAELVSRGNEVPLNWTFGHLRGGTNAIYLPEEKVFLSFFHSATHIPQDPYITYVFGAYTFTAEAPFKLLSYTRYPIMNEQFYTGAWNPIPNRRIDFVVFPMSCFLETIKGERQVMIAVGHQDSKGYLGRIPLKELLENMISIED
jgi:predicted GH43/DUF377 family glycosyl hydrolase